MNIYEELILRTNRDNYPGDYDNGFTLAETMSQIINLIKTLNDNILFNDKQFNILGEKYKSFETNVKNLITKIEGFENGKNIPNHSISLDKLSFDILEQIKDMIYEIEYKKHEFLTFNLDDNGYFNVLKPHMWDDINFETDEENRLVLRF